MMRGIEQEPLAFQKFKDIKELDFIEVKECSFSLMEVTPGQVLTDWSVKLEYLK